MEKIKEINYLRGFATIFVILIHLTSSCLIYPKSSFTYTLFGTLNCALTFAVPMFLFISALIMTYQLKYSDNINWIKFISKRIIKVLSALIFWSIVYVLYHGNLENITLKNIIGYLVLGKASYHLYFIPLIIQLYLIFPLIWIITKKIDKLKINLSSSFLICIIGSAIFQYTFTTVFRLNIFKSFIYFATIIFSYSMPIFIGVWIGYNYYEIKNFFNKCFIALLLLLTTISCFYYVKFEFINYTYKTTLLFSPFYWTLIILTLAYLSRYIKKDKFLNTINKHSFIIYLVHPLILDIINAKINWQSISFSSSTFVNYCIELTIKFSIVFSLSYLIAFLWYKLKKLKM